MATFFEKNNYICKLCGRREFEESCRFMLEYDKKNEIWKKIITKRVLKCSSCGKEIEENLNIER